MRALYNDVASFVESLTPTWRKTQRRNLTEVLLALDERPTLCLSHIARALPQGRQPLHGRLKRLTRFLSNERLDEGALFARWLRLTYRLGSEVTGEGVPDGARATHVVPILLDTVYFEPFAVLLATVPCGSRGLPVALTSYHRTELVACLSTRDGWPRATLGDQVPHRRTQPAVAQRERVPFDSQNQIEERLIDLVWQMLCPRLTPVLVADRGFARASLLEHLLARQRDFVIRIDAQTHIASQADGPSQAVGEAVALRAGEQRWLTGLYYQQQARVPVNLLAVWERGQREPWFLVSSLPCAAWVEQLYRWRMRIECTNRDSKRGVLLRQGGDQHQLHNLWHLHTLVLALACLEWWYALVGLQAWQELPHDVPPAPPRPPTHPSRGPAPPPLVIPHRGPPQRPPGWMRLFTARGWLSYVRLGWEICHAPCFHWLVHHMVIWLRRFVEPYQPLWRPWQLRYRRQQPMAGAT